jgi:hypothetical protein
MPSDGGGIIIIRRKLSEQAIPSIAPRMKVWHVLSGVAFISFVLGAVIF